MDIIYDIDFFCDDLDDSASYYKKCEGKTLLNKDAELFESNDALGAHRPVLTLLDLCAKKVAKSFPYSYVQRNYSNIPEVVAKRIMFWSFPGSSKDIERYSLDLEYCRKHIASWSDFFKVKEIMQVGFCVRGVVSCRDKEFYVSLIFDRCVITHVKCSCGRKHVLWCIHAAILALYRIHYSNNCEVFMSLSKAIDQLDRDQLQKLLQYLLSDHHEKALELVPDVRKEVPRGKRFPVNSPDCGNDLITFAPAQDIPSWFINTKILTNPFVRLSSIKENIYTLMKNIILMMNANDGNGLRILQSLLEAGLHIPFDVQLNDTVNRSWTFSLAAPHISADEKQKFCNLIRSWSCECPDYTVNLYSQLYCNSNRTLAPFENYSCSVIYLMPLYAASITWDDPHLKCILSNDISSKQHLELSIDREFIWREHLPTACVRVRALQLSGCHVEAVRLLVAIARAIKDQLRRWKEMWRKIQLAHHPSDINENLADIIRSAGGEWMNRSLIMHPAIPLQILFNTLVNTPRIIKDRSLIPLVEGQYYQLAVEAAIVILSQREMERSLSWEESNKQLLWFNFIRDALLVKDATVDSSWVIDIHAIKDLMESLIQAGIFTSYEAILQFQEMITIC